MLKVNAAYAEKLAVGLPIIMYILYNFTYTVIATPAGVLSDKMGRRNVLLIGYALFGVTCWGFAFLCHRFGPCGAASLCIGFGSLVGSVIAGVLWSFSHALTFFYGAALSLLSLVLLIGTTRTR